MEACFKIELYDKARGSVKLPNNVRADIFLHLFFLTLL